jgi:hypothetical protein
VLDDDGLEDTESELVIEVVGDSDDEALLEIDVVALLELDVVALCDTVSVRLELEVSDKLSVILEVDEAVDDMLMLWDAAVVTDPLML